MSGEKEWELQHKWSVRGVHKLFSESSESHAGTEKFVLELWEKYIVTLRSIP